MDRKRLLSIIVPAYKQEKTIARDIKRLQKVLSSLSLDYEIIVVVDGIVDKTFEIVKTFEAKNIRILSYEKNRGKGFAIKYGVNEAKGDIIGFIDAGMELDPIEISIMLDIMDFNDADIVIGSKLHPNSKVNYPYFRKILSWGYRTLTHLIFGFNVRDVQVGFKIFKKEVAKNVFPRILVKRFAFDVEVLAVAYNLKYTKIYESPIKLDFKGASAITFKNFWLVILHMLWDTMAVFYRLRILHYYDKKNLSI